MAFRTPGTHQAASRRARLMGAGHSGSRGRLGLLLEVTGGIGTRQGAQDDHGARRPAGNHMRQRRPQLARNPVACNGIAYLLAHDQADLRGMRGVSCLAVGKHVLTTGTGALACDGAEDGRRPQPVHGWEHRSGRQALAALAAARGEDGPTGTGAHPSPETVGLGPTAIIGLERALHDRTPGYRLGKTDAGETTATAAAYEMAPVRSNAAPTDGHASLAWGIWPHLVPWPNPGYRHRAVPHLWTTVWIGGDMNDWRGLS